MTHDWDQPHLPAMTPLRHACANRRRKQPRDLLPPTDRHARCRLALACLAAALALALAYVWLQLAAPALQVAGEIVGRPAAGSDAAGLPRGAAP